MWCSPVTRVFAPDAEESERRSCWSSATDVFRVSTVSTRVWRRAARSAGDGAAMVDVTEAAVDCVGVVGFSGGVDDEDRLEPDTKVL